MSKGKLDRKQILKFLKYILMITIMFIACREIYKIVMDVDINIIKMYSDKFTFVNVILIILLGILAYLPLTLYDFVIKKSANIELSNMKIFKYSWIASSIANVVGFGGSAAIVLKRNFYKEHVDDEKVLLKEVSKIITLNPLGFSGVCLVYSIMNFISNKELQFLDYVGIVTGMYLPIMLVYFLYKFIKNKDKNRYVFNMQMIGISLLEEWLTAIVLLFGLMKILDMQITVAQMFPAYVIAVLVAMISMVPSGVGTFDLTLLLGLQSYNIPTEQILLLILIYRLSYYIAPLIIGIILYLKEVYLNISEDARNLIDTIKSEVAYRVLIVFIIVTGLILICNGAPWIEQYIYSMNDKSEIIYIMTRSNIYSILGFLVIIIARLLYYRTEKIYKIVRVTLVLITFVVIIGSCNIFEYMIVGISWILFILSKKKFYKKDYIYKYSHAIKDCLIITVILIVYLIATYVDINGEILITELSKNMKTFIQTYYRDITLQIGWASYTISILLSIWLRYRNRFNTLPKEPLDERLDKVIEEYGGSRLIHYAYLNDKFIRINNEETVAFQYQVCEDKIIILGNPVGKRADYQDAIQEFYDLADLYGYKLVFTGIDCDIMPELHEMGYEYMKLGQDAYVELDKFSLAGSKNKSNRQAMGRIAKKGYEFDIVAPPFSKDFMNELKEVSDEWLKGRDEKGYCIGFLDEEYINKAEVATVRDESGELKGFASIMPMYDDETFSIDLMRFKKIEFNGLMDYIFIKLFEHGKDHGYTKFNLGLAPLAEVGTSKYAFFRERMAYQLYINGDVLFSFSGLKRFKNKYATIWEDRYIAYRKDTSVVSTIAQLLIVTSRKKNKVKKYMNNVIKC